MQLKGKCKEEFREWFLLNNGHINLSDQWLEEFLELPESMQWGVYQEYFDSVKVSMETVSLTSKIYECNIYAWGFKHIYSVNGKNDSRQQVRTAAIEKACELRNKQLSDRTQEILEQ